MVAALAALGGDSPNRQVTVYLPPGQAKSPQRRYPVLCLLHGHTDSDDRWFGRSGKHSADFRSAAMLLGEALRNVTNCRSRQMCARTAARRML